MDDLTPPGWMDEGPGPVDTGLPAFQRGDHVELGAHLASCIGPAGMVVADEGRIWRCSGSVWEAVDDLDLSQQAMRYAGMVAVGGKTPRAIALTAAGVRGIVECAHLHVRRGGFFAEAPHGAPFRNMFARIDGNGLVVEPLTPEHRVRVEHVPSWDYLDTKDRPKVADKLLMDTWAGCDDIDARVTYLYEWIGASLVGISTRYKDNPLLVGGKDTGKSAILGMITSVFPERSRRSLPLHAFSSDYHRAALSSARINVCNELPSRELLDGEAAKAILSGDQVSCRHPAGRPFEWLPRCAHANACNELPPSRDPALTERFVVLDCPHVVPKHKQNRHLADELRKEAPLIAATALRHLRDLLARGRFVRPESSDGMQSEWRLAGDPVAAWADECVRESESESDVTTDSGTIYEAYREWCRNNGNLPLAQNRLGVKLKALGYEQIASRSDGRRWKLQLVGPARSAGKRSDWMATYNQ